MIVLKYNNLSDWDIFHGELLWRVCHRSLDERWLFFRSFVMHHGHGALLGLGGPLLALRLKCTLVQLVQLFDSVGQKLFINVYLGLM